MGAITEEKDLEMLKKLPDGNFKRYNPLTKSANVKMASGNTLEQDFTTHKADTLYQTAGGTATAITLTGVVLEDGHPKTFIASANNAGAATTINTKPLYKPGGTVAPTLIAGKAYTVWYNLTGGCFFIKASAEGTATVAQVLAGVPFSNETDTGLIGEMANRDYNANGGYSYGTAKGDGTGNLAMAPTVSAYYTPTLSPGGFGAILANDPNFIPENIPSGKTMFGIHGTLLPASPYGVIKNVKQCWNTTSTNYKIRAFGNFFFQEVSGAIYYYKINDDYSYTLIGTVGGVGNQLGSLCKAARLNPDGYIYGLAKGSYMGMAKYDTNGAQVTFSWLTEYTLSRILVMYVDDNYCYFYDYFDKKIYKYTNGTTSLVSTITVSTTLTSVYFSIGKYILLLESEDVNNKYFTVIDITTGSIVTTNFVMSQMQYVCLTGTYEVYPAGLGTMLGEVGLSDKTFTLVKAVATSYTSYEVRVCKLPF